MDAIIERCCGIDVGEATVTACLLTGKADEKPRKVVRTFSAVTRELLALKDWLLAEGCTHVAMESTGVYWDSEWIADLLRHGLIAKSCVPPEPIRKLRDLLRYRRKLVQSRTSEKNRLLKLLESANIKLSSVASDVFGTSGMLMLRALIIGEATPEEMAQLAKGALRKKLAELELALEGRIEQHHRFLLGLRSAASNSSTPTSPCSTRESKSVWRPTAHSMSYSSRSLV